MGADLFYSLMCQKACSIWVCHSPRHNLFLLLDFLVKLILLPPFSPAGLACAGVLALLWSGHGHVSIYFGHGLRLGQLAVHGPGGARKHAFLGADGLLRRLLLGVHEPIPTFHHISMRCFADVLLLALVDHLVTRGHQLLFGRKHRETRYQERKEASATRGEHPRPGSEIWPHRALSASLAGYEAPQTFLPPLPKEVDAQCVLDHQDPRFQALPRSSRRQGRFPAQRRERHAPELGRARCGMLRSPQVDVAEPQKLGS
eukprot:scaffold1804_cov263-Pinguiococcus_pyrenoidosus.AAC.36